MHPSEPDQPSLNTRSGSTLYGRETARALVNFAGCGPAIGAFPSFISALGQVKKAAAITNSEDSRLPRQHATAIEHACDEIIAGHHHEQFVVPILEGSGGTSINMNANEVIAARGEEIGSVSLHPNDHVNLSQSTNDVFPTALKLAIYSETGSLLERLAEFTAGLENRASAFRNVLQVGRTCMQSAQPMYLGQMFGGVAAGLRRAQSSLHRRREALLSVPLGATAIGTGLGASTGYLNNIIGTLAKVTGYPLGGSEDHFDGLQSCDALSRLSAELRVIAELCGKLGSDLIILASDSHGGVGELRLKKAQAGSSIMAGKVNPVLPMLLQQTAYVVQGNDHMVSAAALAGQMQINPFEPAMAAALFSSISLLTNSISNFTEQCLGNITADEDRCFANLRHSSAIASIFLPVLGYDQLTGLVQASEAQNRSFLDIAVSAGLLNEEQIEDRLHVAASGGLSQ